MLRLVRSVYTKHVLCSENEQPRLGKKGPVVDPAAAGTAMSGHPSPLASSSWSGLVHLDYASLYAYWPWLELRSRRLDAPWPPSPSAGFASAPDRPKLSFGIDVILSDRLGSSDRLGPDSALNPNFCWMPTDGESARDSEQQEQAGQHCGGSGGCKGGGSSGSNGSRKRSWSRAVFSNLQRKGLEKRFQLQKYITKPDRRQLAATLGLTDAQVKVWFQNRRMKWRHNREKDSPTASAEQRSDSAEPPKTLAS